MPTTINGIGTHYWGKKNLKTRTALCPHCGRLANLQSYETGLYFVVLFLPIIPLGRKQIIDNCSRCHRHRVIGLREWNEVRGRAIAESRTAAAADPASAEAAIAHHANLVASLMTDEAAKAAADLEARFGNRTDVQMYLGSWHERCGRAAEADACFEKALALSPKDLAARRAVGIGCIQQGNLSRARQLLVFMEKPGPDRDAGVLTMLARAYQAKGQHAEALAMFRMALEARPALGQDRKFRQSVRRSEKVELTGQPMLPAIPLRQRRSVWIAGAAALLAVMLLAAGYYIGANRTVHVVNGFSLPVTVAIDGKPAFNVEPGGLRSVVCPEGRHHAEITLPDKQTEPVDFTNETGWVDRFFTQPVFVLNPGGAAAVLWEQTFYSAYKNSKASVAPNRLYVGQAFLCERDVDYPFQNFPPSITTESHGDIKKTRVAVLKKSPVEIMEIAWDTPAEGTMHFAESHLRAKSDDTPLLRIYFAIATQKNQLDRCRRFLAAGLNEMPLRVEWHRTYQVVSESLGRGDELASEYERRLAQEPGNSALLYLRGRLIENTSKSLPFFERAIQADPKNAYPWRAKAYGQMCVGDFTAARPTLEQALRLQPGDEEIQGLLYQCRFALGEYAALAAETREQQPKEPLDWESHVRILCLLVAMGDHAAAQAEHEDYAARLKKAVPQDPEQVVLLSQMVLSDTEGCYADVLKWAGNVLKPSRLTTTLKFAAYLHLDRPDLAGQVLQDAGEVSSPSMLLVSLGWMLKGDRDKADQWRRRACEAMGKRTSEEKRAAEALEKPTADLADEVLDNDMDADDKACVLIALADRCPERRRELLGMAARLLRAPTEYREFLQRAMRKVGGA